jgi:hypothetical protein
MVARACATTSLAGAKHNDHGLHQPIDVATNSATQNLALHRNIVSLLDKLAAWELMQMVAK